MKKIARIPKAGLSILFIYSVLSVVFLSTGSCQISLRMTCFKSFKSLICKEVIDCTQASQGLSATYNLQLV